MLNSQFHMLRQNSSTCKWKCISKDQILLLNEVVLEKNTKRADLKGAQVLANQFRTAADIHRFIATSLFRMVKE